MSNTGTSFPRRRSVEEIAYHLLSTDWCGNDSIPATGLRFRFDPDQKSWPEVATPLNDGFELWIGTMNQWHTNFTRHDAHRLAWFILWDWWIKGEWFGMRRWLWYKLLTRRVNRWRTHNPLLMDISTP